jgi:hypothetical protein
MIPLKKPSNHLDRIKHASSQSCIPITVNGSHVSCEHELVRENDHFITISLNNHTNRWERFTDCRLVISFSTDKDEYYYPFFTNNDERNSATTVKEIVDFFTKKLPQEYVSMAITTDKLTSTLRHFVEMGNFLLSD